MTKVLNLKRIVERTHLFHKLTLFLYLRFNSNQGQKKEVVRYSWTSETRVTFPHTEFTEMRKHLHGGTEAYFLRMQLYLSSLDACHWHTHMLSLDLWCSGSETASERVDDCSVMIADGNLRGKWSCRTLRAATYKETPCEALEKGTEMFYSRKMNLPVAYLYSEKGSSFRTSPSDDSVWLRALDSNLHCTLPLLFILSVAR